MSDSYQKYIKLLPSQTADFNQTQNSQDNVIFDNINYYANLFESDILIDSITINGTFTLDGLTFLILTKLGCFQKIQHKEMGQILFEQVYQQEKCRMDCDIFWDCQDVAGGNVFFSRVKNPKHTIVGNGAYSWVPAKGIQGQVLDTLASPGSLGQETQLEDGQLTNYIPFVSTGAVATQVITNVRIPLKYFFYNTLYQTKQFNGYLPLKNSELLFQFAQFDTWLKKTTTAHGLTSNITVLTNASDVTSQPVTSVNFRGISLMLNTLNYIPLEKPVQFSYYNTLIEKQTIQTKINDLDVVSDKSLLQVFFQYYPITQTQMAYMNPGWVNNANVAQIIIDELHYSNDKILPRLEGDSAELKLFVKNQLRVINPKLDIDKFFRTTNVVPLVLDNFSLIGETNPAKIRIRYATPNTHYQLLMMQVTSRIIQISQQGLELLI